VQKEQREKKPSIQLIESEAVSWWTWRPGIKPLRAFVFGGLLTLLALLLLTSGITTLIGGILDSSGLPLRVPGMVTGHSKDILGSSQLILRLEQSGFPSSITLVVSSATFITLTNGTAVTVDYGPYLHVPYALENGGHIYSLPGTSASGNLFETLLLLLVGLLLLPYPFLLSLWGWRDLRTRQRHQLTAFVVALRAAKQTTTRTPGMVPRTINTWHGVALQVESASTSPTKPEILTFGIRQEVYSQLHRGDRVQVTYSPHLHHLYTLQHLASEQEVFKSLNG
jgi:hypothetical protein